VDALAARDEDKEQRCEPVKALITIGIDEIDSDQGRPN